MTVDSGSFTDAPLLTALAQPWASVVLSGAVTRAQLDAKSGRAQVASFRRWISPNLPARTGRPGQPGRGAEPPASTGPRLLRLNPVRDLTGI